MGKIKITHNVTIQTQPLTHFFSLFLQFLFLDASVVLSCIYNFLKGFFNYCSFGCGGSAVHGLSLVWRVGAALHCGARASRCSGYSCCRAQALGTWASVVGAHGPSGSRGLDRTGIPCIARQILNHWTPGNPSIHCLKIGSQSGLL